jgi:hypothetical protein
MAKYTVRNISRRNRKTKTRIVCKLFNPANNQYIPVKIERSTVIDESVYQYNRAAISLDEGGKDWTEQTQFLGKLLGAPAKAEPTPDIAPAEPEVDDDGTPAIDTVDNIVEPIIEQLPDAEEKADEIVEPEQAPDPISEEKATPTPESATEPEPEEDTPEPAVVPAPTPGTKEYFEAMTVAMLRQYAKDNDLDISLVGKKPVIIDNILSAING